MGSCGDLGIVHETLHGAIIEQPSSSDFSEEPISKEGLCFEGVDNLTDCKETSTTNLDGCNCDSRDKNAGFLGSNCEMKTVDIDKFNEMKGDSTCTVGTGVRNSGEKESRVSSNQGGYERDVCKVETGGLCSEKVGALGQDGLLSPSETSQAVSIGKTMMATNAKCFKEIEQMQVRDTISSSEIHFEGLIDGVAVPSNDNDRQEGFVSEELELTDRLIPDASLPVNCQKREDRKESEDINFSLVPVPVPVVSTRLQEKEDMLTKADEVSDVSKMPFGGIESDAQLTFIIDAPRNYLEHCRSLERSAFDARSFNNTVDFSRLTDDDVRIGSEVLCGPGTHFSETILSYSPRRGQDGKQSKKAQTKRVASRSRKPLRMKRPWIKFESIFKCSKQKRSCFSKPARSSEWGLLGNTAQRFSQDNNFASNRPPNLGSQESHSNRRNGEHVKNCLTGCPEGSKGKNQTRSGGCLRLKVKFGKSSGLNPLNIMVPKVIDESVPTNDNGTAGAGLEISRSANSVKDNLQNGETIKQLNANNSVMHISYKEPDDSLMGTKLEKEDSEAAELHGNPVGDAADDDLLLSSCTGVEECGTATKDSFMDAETSPDSEVINIVPDTLVSARHQGDFHPTRLSSSKTFAATVDATKKKKDKKKGTKNDYSLHASRSILEDGSSSMGSTNKSKQPTCLRMKGRRESSSLPRDILSPICVKSSSYTHCSEDLPSELGVEEETLELESCKGAQMHLSFRPQSLEACGSKKAFASAKSKGKSKSPEAAKNFKCNGTKKGKSLFSDSGKCRRRNDPVDPVEGDDRQKLVNKSMVKDDVGGHDAGRVELHGATELLCEHFCQIDGNAVKTSADVNPPDTIDGEMALGGTTEESASTDSAWVRCDDCFKWRRIPASLVESIDENCRWICMNNLNKDFGDCSIPQEMSNEEINEELGIKQDEADAYDGYVTNKEKKKGQECKRSSVNQKACFKALKLNHFLHRNRKAQTIDEIMVCHCKPPLEGQLGCGDECLNRMLNIECVQGTCPCGDLCSNQQFQKRKYTRFERFQSGKKGYGLRLLEDVRNGQFLIEYVGEVLDMQAYETRQKEYAAKGQKHFYFMTLNGNEVIDAGAKGNLGRFINHSCEPNCRTEKWMVNGEICVGIYSLRDIKKGEEVTFDYNYVRVFGAAAKRCYCGSLHCRGYIGGDPLNGDVIIQSDSDEEYPEPVMLEDDESGNNVLDTTSRICSDAAEAQMAQNLPKMDNSEDNSSAASQSQISVSAELLEGELLPSLRPSEVSKEHTTGMSVAAVQLETSTEGENASTSSPSVVVSRLSLNNADADKKNKHGSSEEKRMFSRPCPLMKTSRPSVSVKRDKGSNLPGAKRAQIVMANKLQQQPSKSKGSIEVSPSGRIETFEGKLNELLDAEGGISKRKDSTKGYLKLLLLTAASRGNANNEGIQSNRDLSMILDALLKTKSRAVLLDVINKNGLQMLHNIMKQYRRDFKKTPILRKLLKVLEYLAAREILTLEHIIRRPPCLGMESFKDSILTLTEHDDKQVHQIARNFRDRWIPKPFRKHRYMDRDERFESTREHHNSGLLAPQAVQSDNQYVRPAEPVVAVLSSRAATSETASVSEGCSEANAINPETNGAKTRKRKSRWDQPAKKKEQRVDSTLPQKTDELKDNQNIQDDIPPGFSLPLKQPYNNALDIVVARPQSKFLSRLPVSYGIPLTIVHEFGSPDKDASDTWLVAPAMPFLPFPPLPPVSRESYLGKKSGSVSSSTNEHCSGQSTPSTAVSSQGCWNIPAPGPETNLAYNRKREFSFDIGRRYFRQQKWNVQPWIRHGWENAGNNFRGMEHGSVTCEKFSNSYCSQGTDFDPSR